MIRKSTADPTEESRAEKDYIIPRPPLDLPGERGRQEQSSAVFGYDTDKYDLVTPGIKGLEELERRRI